MSRAEFLKFFSTPVRTPALASALVLALLPASCAPHTAQPAPKPSLTNYSQEAPQVFQKPSQRTKSSKAANPSTQTSSPAQAADAPAWSILLMSFQGPSAQQAAAQALAELRTSAALQDAYLEQRSGASVLLYGNYPSPDDARAQADLARLKSLSPGAILVPPNAGPVQGSLPEFDLATARAKLGKSAVWSLQVAIYTASNDVKPTPEDIAQFRALAEKAVLELRKQGEEAFYYHGPWKSTVTVGVFGEADQITTTRDEFGRVQQLPRPRESLKLLEARRAHPHNLVNGQQYLVKRPGDAQGRAQESFLVKIPD